MRLTKQSAAPSTAAQAEACICLNCRWRWLFPASLLTVSCLVLTSFFPLRVMASNCWWSLYSFYPLFRFFFLHNTTTKLTVKWLDGRPGQGKYLIWSKSFSFVAVYLAILRSPFDISMTDLISKLWQESGSQPFAVPHPASYVPHIFPSFPPIFPFPPTDLCAVFVDSGFRGRQGVVGPTRQN